MLTVPGDFIANHGHQTDHSFQLQRLRDQVRTHPSLPLDMAPPPHPFELSFNGPNLFSSVAMPTAPPYSVSMKVLSRSLKVTFKVYRYWG